MVVVVVLWNVSPSATGGGAGSGGADPFPDCVGPLSSSKALSRASSSRLNCKLAPYQI